MAHNLLSPSAGTGCIDIWVCPEGAGGVYAEPRDEGISAATLHTSSASARETTAIIDVFQTLTVLLIACALTPALAHALELPGKLRLTKEAYFAVQPIYYPGFTIAGLSEPLGILATLLLVLTPRGHADFWLTLVALLGLLGMQAVYWLWTHSGEPFLAAGRATAWPGRSFLRRRCGAQA
jgi:hypothetical protein